MAKYAGEDLVLKVETTPGVGTFALVGASSEHTISITNESVDTTDKDSSRWGEASAYGKRSVSVSMSGFVSDNANFAIVEAAVEGDTVLNYQLDYGNSKTIECAFHISSFEYTGANNTAQTFSLSMESQGTPTFT